MKVDVTKLPESRVALRIELTPEEVGQALDRTYKQMVQRVVIPGFRKGKAPRAVVERMFGHEAFVHEATEEAVRWGYRKAIDSEDLTPIDEAEISSSDDSHEHVEVGEPFTFEATVAVRPEVQLPDYHAIQIERSQEPVDDSKVDELLSDLRDRSATLEPVSRPAKLGDVLTISITGTVDGDEVLNNENADLELRTDEAEQQSMLPGLSSHLLGASPADIREVTLQLPDLYPEAELAGKSMFVRILVKDVKRKVLADLNDEFAESVSKFTTLDELRDALRVNLDLELRAAADQKLIAEAVEAVTSRTFVEIPPILIDEELDRMIDDVRGGFESRHLSWQDYLEHANRSEAEIRADMRDEAITNVKSSLVLSAVADAEGIEVSARELDSALEELFRSAGTSEPERRRLRSSPGVRSNIRSRVRRQRAVQRLVEIMSGGEEVSAEAAEALADQTAGVAGDTQETVAVEVGG